MGIKFHAEIEKIKDQRLKNGRDKERISTERVTNLIVRHKEGWDIIANDIINADEKEVKRYGLG